MHKMIQDDEYGLPGPAGKVPVKIGTRIRLVDPANIVYAKSCGDYVDIVLASGETLHTKEQITRLEARLPIRFFARVHRSYLVNTGCIKEVRARRNGYELVLNNEKLIASSSTYRYQIRDRILLNPGHGIGAIDTRRGGDRVNPVQRPRWPERGAEQADGLRLRACKPGDEHKLALIGQVTYMETFAGYQTIEDILAHCATRHSPDFYREWLEDPEVCIWVLEQAASGASVGYMAVAQADMPVSGCRTDELAIQRIYLKEGWQHRDIEARLFENAVSYAQERGSRRLWASDYVKNDRALEFYARSGFKSHAEYLFRVGGSEYRDVALRLDL